MTTKLDVAEIVDIVYDKDGELQDRTIVPFAIPTDFYRAIDVTALDDEDRKRVAVAIADFFETSTAITAYLTANLPDLRDKLKVRNFKTSKFTTK